MKTLTITEARKNLGALLKAAGRGEEVAILSGSDVIALRKVEVEAVVSKIIDTPVPTIYANGFLKVDGLYIYQMDNFGFRLIPI